MKSPDYLTKVYSWNHFLTRVIFLLILSPEYSLQAQIIPDMTLPVNSLISPNGNTFIINGGTQAEGNLFHSFSEFSIPSGSEAYFNNASTIQNIISRVTGSTLSNIDGLIRANGNANLFLLNPNGIIFGANASLDIGGSFLASTANSLRFEDGSEFSANNPSASHLLTVSVPIGLQFRQNSSLIRLQGTGHSLESIGPLINFSLQRGESKTGLRVKPANTIALVGGAIDIEGGILTAEDGHIELGSINSGLVKLNATPVGWDLSYEGVESFQNIQLRRQSLVDASGMNSGSIQVQGERIAVKDGSVIWSENRGSQAGGNIRVNAAHSLELGGFSSRVLNGKENVVLSLIFTQATGEGKGGDITISTRKLVVGETSNIDTLTLEGGAKGGNINVYAADSVEVIGGSPIINSSIIARTTFSGDAGNVTVSTNKLKILNGSNILSGAAPGRGNAGNVTVNAYEIELSGVDPLSFLPSAIASPTTDQGNSGNIEINTSRLLLRQGGQISSSTLSRGNSGKITINASEFVEVSDKVTGSVNPSQIISSANIVDEETQNILQIPPIPTGNSGNVIINTPKLVIADGGQVTVRNDGTGSAGNLQINADSIFLNNQGRITASTESGEGGNISLNVQDILHLRNDSFISATAGGTGNGGNINIDTKFLIASPPKGSIGSDIIANAEQGNGGKININAQGIFGIEFRPAQTSFNDITASSEFGLAGEVQLNVPDIDPNRAITELPANIIDSTALIAQNPCKKGAESQFIVTGRGGLPPSINEDLSNEAVQVGLVEPASTVGTEEQIQKPSLDTAKIQNPIVPAQGWVFNDKGEAVLTAYNPNVTEPQRIQEKSDTCPVP